MGLDLLAVYQEDSGVYQCKARNAYGEAVTSATVRVNSESISKVFRIFPHTIAVYPCLQLR